jgi:hypothetical protein
MVPQLSQVETLQTVPKHVALSVAAMEAPKKKPRVDGRDGRGGLTVLRRVQAGRDGRDGRDGTDTVARAEFKFSHADSTMPILTTPIGGEHRT